MAEAKDAALVVERLRKWITESGATVGLSGSQAGTLIRLYDPSFDPRAYGCESLAQLIARYAHDIQIVAYTGPDPIYGFASWSPSVISRPTASTATDLWRIWVSPLSRWALIVNRGSGAVAAAPRGQRQTDKEAKVEPASVEDHRQMARDFLAAEAFSPEVRYLLDGTTQGPASTWWRNWILTLTQRAPHQVGKWHHFRDGALETLLHSALAKGGIEGAEARAAFDRIVGTRRKRPFRAAVPETIDGTAKAIDGARPFESVPAERDVVALAQAVIGRMSDRDIRALPLPLGLVLDALRAKKSEVK